MDHVLPCNGKLLTLWKANPSHPSLKAQVEKELRLERQKIRVVLQFMLIKNLLTKAQGNAYRKRSWSRRNMRSIWLTLGGGQRAKGSWPSSRRSEICLKKDRTQTF